MASPSLSYILNQFLIDLTEINHRTDLRGNYIYEAEQDDIMALFEQALALRGKLIKITSNTSLTIKDGIA